jgi:hypothetical protein
MSDFQEQLAYLRRRIAKIDKKFASPKPTPKPPSYVPPPETYLPFDEIETDPDATLKAKSFTKDTAVTAASASPILSICRTIS